MRRIAIVGAGQAGLQLALGLREHGYDVTLHAARTPDEVRGGTVLSTQVMYGPAHALERAAGLALWEAGTPAMTSLRVTPTDPAGSPRRGFTAPFDEPAHSVDQRVKTARWLELFEERGGRTAYGTVGPEQLEGIAGAHDLTVVSSGRGPLSELFGRDERHSPYDRPQRTLATVYVHGATPRPDADGPQLRATSLGGQGEFFALEGTTLDGPCGILLWEAVPGGPLDRWQDPSRPPSPDDVLGRGLDLLRTHAPWEYELCAGARPTDAGAALVGAVTPVVRHPVARVAPDVHVLGMADAVVVNDPVTGQGANSAARCADGYLRAILDHGEKPFDRTWMLRTFTAFWEHARHAVSLTNLLLGSPPPEHVRRVLAAAEEHPEVAHRYANGFADPAGFWEWMLDAERCAAYVAAVTGRAV
ncbi:styrene monooxygenase/indole monooxygenase family protein [Streptomyces sp. UNOC14_S4]|uniref:styrene monooxygenase/indole monooxygenase family protein n=1 Tax=Streptomyces sp. UNOC14_S4 TaxID=2872340 RepID=UPI001E602472|nr:styrene monooxygenase/indole monooxygenase family protein [Streptomyces sp. UNOC14_S4]MCC3769709.1 FAD-binding oxidoreductase [Streptomyces sp. UNOC14_S4]